MAIVRKLTVIAVHGEGDREALLMSRLADVPPNLAAVDREAIINRRRDELLPEVTVVLADADRRDHFEIRLTDWAEVEALKEVVGFDTSPHPVDGNPRRHWILGGTVRVTLEKAEA